MKKPFVISILALMILSGCSGASEVVLPTGPQVVSGILQPVPVSLKRRGTHALMGLDGKMISFAESTAVNLHVLEGREVQLQGVLEKNSDPAALPVFVVSAVIDGGTALSRPFLIPALGLRIEVPSDWKGALQKKTATFTASGFSVPVLTITEKDVAASSSPGSLYGPLPVPSSLAGEPVVVGLRKAVALRDAGSWLVRVINPTAETQFRFALRTDVPEDQQLNSYRSILQTVSFSYGTSSSAKSSSSARSVITPSSANGSMASSRAAGEGAPCGGSAGILCPSGFYCHITDRPTQTGVCAKR